jgi:hypothetical protein
VPILLLIFVALEAKETPLCAGSPVFVHKIEVVRSSPVSMAEKGAVEAHRPGTCACGREEWGAGNVTL